MKSLRLGELERKDLAKWVGNCLLGSGGWLCSFQTFSTITQFQTKVSKSGWSTPVCPCPVREQTHLLCKEPADAWKWKGGRNAPVLPRCKRNTHSFIYLFIYFCLWGCFPAWVYSGCLLSNLILLTHGRDGSCRSTQLYQPRFFPPLINKRTPSWLCLTSPVYWICCFPSSFSY